MQPVNEEIKTNTIYPPYRTINNIKVLSIKEPCIQKLELVILKKSIDEFIEELEETDGEIDKRKVLDYLKYISSTITTKEN